MIRASDSRLVELKSSTIRPFVLHESEILEYGFWLRKEGYSEHTIFNDLKRLRRLDRCCSILEPEAIKRFVANQNWNNGGKQHICEVVNRFYTCHRIKWEQPRYPQVETLPFIPHTDEVDALISGLVNSTLSTFTQLIKETGGRPGEIWQLRWIDFDPESRLVNITPEKGSLPRTIKITHQLTEKLNQLPRDRQYVFHADDADPIKSLVHFNRNWLRQRKQVATRLSNPRLHKISWRTLRHYKGTMEYHKTRDIIHVKQILGHKSINNTMRYVTLLPHEDDDFLVKIVTSREDRIKLLEEGFDLIKADGEEWYLRKRK